MDDETIRPWKGGRSSGPAIATRRRWLGRLEGGAAAVLLAACGPLTPKTTSSQTELPPAKITLSHYDGLTQQAQRWVLWTEGFRARNPHVTVDILQITEGYLEKIPTMFAADSPPDVAIVNGNWTHSWFPHGYFLQLDPILSREKYDLSDFWGYLHQKVYVYRGKRYGMTNMSGAGNLGLNVTHFRKRGVPLPSTDWKDLRWNWDSYLDTLKRLTTAGDGGAGAWGTTDRYLYQAIWSYGGQLMDPNYGECILDRPAATEAIQFIADLALKHRVAPTPPQLAGKNPFDMWVNGEIAIYSVHAGQFSSLRDQIKGFEWDVAPDPAGPKGRFGGSGGFGACIAAPSKATDAAWGWIKHWISPETQRMNIERQLTINASRRSIAAQYVEIARKTAGGQPPASLHVVAEQPNYEGQHMYTNRWLDMDRIVNEELSPVWSGQATAKEAMQKAKPRIDAIINEERAKDPRWP